MVSALLWPSSTPAHALRRVVAEGEVLLSLDLQNELNEVFGRPKFDEHASRAKRFKVLDALFERCLMVAVTSRASDCRDQADNMVLDLAFGGGADVILTGDKDLLVLHPWREIAILSPAAYLALSSASSASCVGSRETLT